MPLGWDTLIGLLGRRPPAGPGHPSDATGPEIALQAALAHLPVAVWSTDHTLRVTSFRGGALPPGHADAAPEGAGAAGGERDWLIHSFPALRCAGPSMGARAAGSRSDGPKTLVSPLDTGTARGQVKRRSRTF